MCGLFGLVALATLAALLAYPSWQLALAAVCMVALVPVWYVVLGSMLAPFAPGVSAGSYLAGAGWAVLGVALFVAGGLMFSTAPVG